MEREELEKLVQQAEVRLAARAAKEKAEEEANAEAKRQARWRGYAPPAKP